MKAYRVYCEKKSYFYYKKFLKRTKGKLPNLTREQKSAVKDLWEKKGPFNYDTHKLVYWATGKFDARIVPEKFIRLSMEFALNNQMGKYAWADKNIFDMILPDENLPKVLVRNIEGCFYDKYYTYLSEDKACEILSAYDNVFFKPAIDSGKGNGIKIINSFDKKNICELGKNWVIQEILNIHPFFKKLNITAVTIIRMVSFYLNGEVYVTSASVRVGMEGAITDYSETIHGDGCLIIGVTSEGVLKEYGYYPSGKKSNTAPNGFEFGGKTIPNYSKTVELIKEAHKKLPHYRFIAWDVTLNEFGKPIIIEYNIKGPGVLYYQYTNGTLFGDYFDTIYENLG